MLLHNACCQLHNITVGNTYLWCGSYDWMSSHYELNIQVERSAQQIKWVWLDNMHPTTPLLSASYNYK